MKVFVYTKFVDALEKTGLNSVNGILFEKSETITMIHLYIFQR